jgi:class 3 adenylate cyclase
MTESSSNNRSVGPRVKERTVRFRLATMFIAVSFLSVLLIGALNFVMTRQLIDDGVQNRLSSVAEARGRTIELGVSQLRSEVQVVAADGAIAQALDELTTTFGELSTSELAPDDDTAIDEFYQRQVVSPLEGIGIDVEADDVAPTSSAGRYLQYHYLVDPANSDVARADVVDAGDGSTYSEAHARHHPFLSNLASQLSGGDLLLIDPSGTIVYSTDKRLDVGTSLEDGPYEDTELADAVLKGIPLASNRETVLADWQLYLPAAGKPTLFLVASVRRDATTLGSIAVEIPSPALSNTTTANGDWAAVGLPRGESYVVGPDLRLRSESRLWIEDPDRYLSLVDDDQQQRLLIETFGSPVGIQIVDTEPAIEALDGERFEGTSVNYLGQSTFTSAIPLDIDGVNWVVVVDTPIRETRDGLYEYATRMGILLAIVLPLSGLIGFIFAHRFSGAIPPLVEAAKAVADGERNPTIAATGGGELTDLGRRLERLTGELARQEQDLEDEYDRRRDLLLSVLPSRLVNRQGEIGEDVDDVRRATVIAIGLELAGAQNDEGPTLVELASPLRNQVVEAGAKLGIEPVRLAADRYLFVTGAGSDSVHADEALRFAGDVALMASNLDVDDDEVHLAANIGLASGTIATGVLETGSLTFAAWGEPVRRALAISALAQIAEILVDGTTAAALTPDRFRLEPARNVISLDGEPLAVERYRPAPRPAPASDREPADVEQ